LSDARQTMQDGRLGGPPSAANLEHSGAPHLQYELHALYAFVQVDMAHTTMLAERAILSEEHAGAILRVLREIGALGPARFPVDPRYGSMLPQVERYLAERIGEDTAGRMHTGRSRNDQSTAVSRLFARDRLLEVHEALLALQDTVLALAAQHVETLMPGYTHLQHAQPTTLGHYLMRHYFTLERDQQRVEGAFARTNLSALGGAAMAGTSWPIDRDRVAELLGHDRPVENAYDAGIFARDYPAENAAVLSILVNDVGRICGDLYLWSTWEFGLVEIDDALAGTSSIMPQKKNPHAFERVRGLSGGAIGWLPAALGMLRSVSSSDLDLHFGEDPMPSMAAVTMSVLELTRASLDTTTFRTDVMAARAGVFWSTATNLADEIVRATDLPFRTVHAVVGRLVRIAIERGIPPEGVTPVLLDEAAEATIGRTLALPEDLVRRSLDPREAIRGLVTPGSAHPSAVADTIAVAHDRQAGHRSWSDEARTAIRDSRAELDRAADRLIAGDAAR
jgi:argininosuccinate lyase